MDLVAPHKIDPLIEPVTDSAAALWPELWISLASLLRSYTVAHGLHDNRIAQIESDAAHIRAHHGEKWLNLRREGSRAAWVRENGESGVFELTESGRLRCTVAGNAHEEEMDMAAERWARELMQ